MDTHWPADVDELIAWLRDYTPEQLAELGLEVRGTFDEVDDPTLVGPGGLTADSWREDHPYSERLSGAEYEETKRLLRQR